MDEDSLLHTSNAFVRSYKISKGHFYLIAELLHACKPSEYTIFLLKRLEDKKIPLENP